jgi:hypothetical protein
MSVMRFTLAKLFLVLALASLACAGLFSPTYWWTAATVSITLALFVVTCIRAIGLKGRERVFVVTFVLVGFAYLLLATNFLTRSLAKALVTNYPIAAFAILREQGWDVSSTTSAYFPPPAGFAGPTSAAINTSVADADASAVVQASALSPSADAIAQPVSAVTAALPTPPPTPMAVTAVFPSPAVGQTVYNFETFISEGFSDEDIRSSLAHTFLIGHCVWSWLIALIAGWLAGRVYSKRQIGQPSPTP